jgi:hypothetical protein
MVVTTCLSLDEIETRISSRMVDPGISPVFNVTAPDHRSNVKPTRQPKRYQVKRFPTKPVNPIFSDVAIWLSGAGPSLPAGPATERGITPPRQDRAAAVQRTCLMQRNR